MQRETPDLPEVFHLVRSNFSLPQHRTNELFLLAAEKGNLDAVKVLHSKGANLLHEQSVVLPHCSNASQTIIDIAVRNKDTQMLKWIGENITPKQANQLMPHALYYKNIEMLKFLNKCGAEVNLPGKYKPSYVYEAAEHGDAEVVKTLCDLGANLETADKYGNRAVHKAAQNGYVDVLKALHDAGADMTVPDEYGDLPVELAKRSRHRIIGGKPCNSAEAVQFLQSINAGNKAVS
jgi:uncharacterized protein